MISARQGAVKETDRRDPQEVDGGGRLWPGFDPRRALGIRLHIRPRCDESNIDCSDNQDGRYSSVEQTSLGKTAKSNFPVASQNLGECSGVYRESYNVLGG
jgi:hypothetical protein